MARITIQNLQKRFGDFVAVSDSSFAIEDGEFFCLLGPSGCGKTTTLRMIAGLELPTAGTIHLGSDDVTFKRASARDIAFVFQLFALYPHMNVSANIGFPLKCDWLARSEIRRRVDETARILRIQHLLGKLVSGLSSGDRQRVALGRAIVRRPKAFLMDEPLGALDAEFRHVMCGELRALHRRLNATTVYVTHDQLEAMSLADKIAIMNEGIVEQLSTPQEIYDRPASLFVADFIGSPPMNFIRLRAELRRGDNTVSVDGEDVKVPTLCEDPPEPDLVLGVRPEHVSFSDKATFRGLIFGVEYLGTTQIVTVTTDRGAVKARLPSTLRARAGEQVGLVFRPEKLSLFAKTSGRAIRSTLHEVALGAVHG
jgi:multiple sugar transport system ATP-binding protein